MTGRVGPEKSISYEAAGGILSNSISVRLNTQFPAAIASLHLLSHAAAAAAHQSFCAAGLLVARRPFSSCASPTSI